MGKSTLITSLKPDLSINLSAQDEFLTFSSRPSELQQRVESYSPRSVFIDEVQRHPAILNTIQALVDRDKVLKFYLTGSSARKLKGLSRNYRTNLSSAVMELGCASLQPGSFGSHFARYCVRRRSG